MKHKDEDLQKRVVQEARKKYGDKLTYLAIMKLDKALGPLATATWAKTCKRLKANKSKSRSDRIAWAMFSRLVNLRVEEFLNAMGREK